MDSDYSPLTRGRWSARVASGLLGMALFGLVASCDSAEDRARDHVASARQYLVENEPDKALIEFRNALRLDPRIADAHYEIGGILERQSDPASAFNHYRVAADLAPDHLAAKLKMAELHLLRNDLRSAELEIDAALARAPGNPDVIGLAAGLALRRSAPEKARELLDRALGANPTSLRALAAEVGYLSQTRDPAAALRRLDEALSLHPDSLVFHVMKYELLRRDGKPAAARQQLRAMIERFPDRTGLREEYARAARMAGDAAAAESALRALADMEPENFARVTELVIFLLEERGRASAVAEIEARQERAPERRELRMMLAELHLATGDEARAAKVLQGAASGSGAIAHDARVRLARLHHARGDVDAADAEIAAVLAQDPGHVGALRFRILRLLESHEIDAAIRTARRALEAAPQDAALLELAARAQELAGNIDLANYGYAKAVRAAGYAPRPVDRYAAFLVRANRLAGAETVLTEAVARFPTNSRLLELLALARIALEDWDGAAEAATALAPLDSERARQLRASVLIGQRRFDESAALLDADGNSVEAESSAMARIVRDYIARGEFPRAEAYLGRILAESPENVQALGLRGNLHMISGQRSQAEALYREILRLDPANAGAFGALAVVLDSTGDLAGAEDIVREGIAASPENPALLVQLARYRERSGDIDAAISIYERVYRDAPDSLLVANNLASLLADHRGDSPEAVARAYRIASRLRDSHRPAYRDTYAWTRHLRGEHEEAHAHLAAVAKALPRNPWVRYHLATVLTALDRNDEAAVQFRTALGLAGDAAFAPRSAIERYLTDLEKD